MKVSNYYKLLWLALAIAVLGSCSSRKPHGERDRILYKDAKLVHMMKWETFEEYTIKRKY